MARPQSGIPATTDVTYDGLNIDAQFGKRYGQHIGLDVFGGVGFDVWTRSINDGTTATGTLVNGYSEHYTILYGKGGWDFFQLFDGWRYMLQGGVKMPLITSERVKPGRRR